MNRTTKHRMHRIHRAALGLASLVLAAAAGLLPAGAASAQPHGHHGGPGGFHSPWQHLSERFDTDGDGVVSATEWDGQALFAELDRNGDGALSADDFPAHRRHPHGPRGGGLLIGHADTDEDGALSAAEWQSFLGLADPDGDGIIDRDELHGALFGEKAAAMRRRHAPEGEGEHRHPAGHPLDRDGDGVLEVEDLQAAFTALDADGDGALSAEELPRHRGPHMRHRGPGSGAPGA